MPVCAWHLEGTAVIRSSTRLFPSIGLGLVLRAVRIRVNPGYRRPRSQCRPRVRQCPRSARARLRGIRSSPPANRCKARARSMGPMSQVIGWYQVLTRYGICGFVVRREYRMRAFRCRSIRSVTAGASRGVSDVSGIAAMRRSPAARSRFWGCSNHEVGPRGSACLPEKRATHRTEHGHLGLVRLTLRWGEPYRDRYQFKRR